MWATIAIGFIAVIILLFIVLICYVKSNERRIRNLEKQIADGDLIIEQLCTHRRRIGQIEKRRIGQDIVTEHIYTTLLHNVERLRFIEGALRHYKIVYPYQH